MGAAGLVVFAWAALVGAEDYALPDNDVLMRALTDELDRSMKELVLEGLGRPYFIQYVVEDAISLNVSAQLGDLVRSNEDRSRTLGTRVRVGSMELDNSNVGYGGRSMPLPIDDDYLALRHAIWLATDTEYKYALEVLAWKEARLKERKIEDRPDDFTPAPPTILIEPPGRITFDRKSWEDNVRKLSARFKAYPQIEDSGVSLFIGASNGFVVNSEGTRYRHGDTGILVTVHASLRGKEGMRQADSRTYLGEQVDQIPSLEKILADINTMCADLIAGAQAPMIDHYVGPVLFEPRAAGKVFESLLAPHLSAKPVTVGGGGNDMMEKKIGLRILPRSFQIYDDPGPKFFEDEVVAASYKYDDEAVPAQRVNLVENGILKTLVASRTPSRKIKRTTGHGRGRYGGASARVGCLYIQDDEAVSPEEIKAELIQAARDEGLEFALRVAAMGRGGFRSLGKPLYAFKVYVEDGHEEPVRGLKFLPVEIRSLKDILAATNQRPVYNSLGSVLTSFIAPAVLFEELELTKVEQQFDTLPILKSPATREKKKPIR